MTEMILGLKECLGLILLTGMVTGYLYTLLASREKYKPKLDEIKAEEAATARQIKALENDYAALQDETQAEKERLEKVNGEIAEAKENIHNMQKSLAALRQEKANAQEQYASTHAIYTQLKEREEALMNDIGGDTLSSLLEKEKAQQERIGNLQKQLAHETDELEETMQRHKRVTAQKEELEARYSHLAETYEALEREVKEKSSVAETLESTIQQKIAQLSSEAEGWMEKMKAYREKLLQLRENR